MAIRTVIQMRIPERLKLRWQKAAKQRGQTLSMFVMIAVMKELNGSNLEKQASAPARS